MKKSRQFHRNPQQILREMNIVARETRMAAASTWTVGQMLTCYTMLKCEGWKQKRLNDMIERMDELESMWWNSEIDLEDFQEQMNKKVGFMVIHNPYGESDLVGKKGSYIRTLDRAQLAAQNEINFQMTRILTWFYSVLMENGYGKQRAERIEQFMDAELQKYIGEHDITSRWRAELLDEVGIYFEIPVDKRTGTESVMA